MINHGREFSRAAALGTFTCVMCDICSVVAAEGESEQLSFLLERILILKTKSLPDTFRFGLQILGAGLEGRREDVLTHHGRINARGFLFVDVHR